MEPTPSSMITVCELPDVSGILDDVVNRSLGVDRAFLDQQGELGHGRYSVISHGKLTS